MKRFLIIFTFIVGFVLTACGGQNNTEPQEALIEYTRSSKKVGLADIDFIEAYSDTAGQLIYIGTSMNGGEDVKQLFIADKEILEDEESKDNISGATLEMETGERSNIVFGGSPESICVISAIHNEENRTIFFNTFGKDGVLIEKKDITKVCEEAFDLKSETYFQNAAMDAAGRIYVQYYGSQSGVFILDAAGELLKNIPCEEAAILDIQMVGDVLYLVQRFEDTRKKEILLKIDSKSFNPVEVAEIPDGRSCTYLTSADNDTLWISDYTGIWQYSVSGQSMSKVFDWMEAGVEGKEIKDITVDTKGNVAAILKKQPSAKTQNILYLQQGRKDSSQEEQEKITITIGSGADILLEKTVTQFNASNDKYNVVIEAYEKDKILTEIIAGKGPDLIRPEILGLEIAVEKGIVEDLTPYLEKSENIDREDLYEGVLEEYTIDNKLVCIPPSFDIMAPCGLASELGTEPGWTIEEFMDYIESHRGATIYAGSSVGDSRLYLIGNYVNSVQDKLVDYTNKQAYFDTEEFHKIMEYAKGYETLYDNEIDHHDAQSVGEKMREGKILLYDFPIKTPTSYMEYKQAFKEDMVVIGYPSTTGEVNYRISTSREFAINANSEQKEGAWEFIEFMLLVQEEEVKDSRSRWNDYFSTYMPALNYQFEEAIKDARYYRGQEIDPDIYEQKKQDIEATWGIIEKASQLYGMYDTIGSIAYEEYAEYLNNGPEYTADMAIDKIQNRVQLYLDEME